MKFLKGLKEVECIIGSVVIGVVGLFTLLTITQKADKKVKDFKNKKFNKKVDELFEEEEEE